MFSASRSENEATLLFKGRHRFILLIARRYQSVSGRSWTDHSRSVMCRRGLSSSRAFLSSARSRVGRRERWSCMQDVFHCYQRCHTTTLVCSAYEDRHSGVLSFLLVLRSATEFDVLMPCVCFRGFVLVCSLAVGCVIIKKGILLVSCEKKKKTKCVFRNLMMTMSAKADLICREDVKENWSLRDGFSLPRLDESPK